MKLAQHIQKDLRLDKSTWIPLSTEQSVNPTTHHHIFDTYQSPSHFPTLLQDSDIL